jgi:hypothetical protein
MADDGGDEVLGRDVREVLDDERTVLGAVQDALQARIHTAYPIEFVEFDKKKQVAEVKIQTKGVRRKKDGTVEKVEIENIKGAPVYFPSGGRQDSQQQQSQQQAANGSGGSSGGTSGGGTQKKKDGYMLTFPIKKGDQGIAIIASRGFDKWHEEDGMQDQGTSRMHHISDMMILPGMKSRPRAEDVKDGVDDKGPQLRSVNGDHKYGMDENEDGGLYSKTTEHIKNGADKNVETEAGKDMTHKAGENMSRETGKVESAKAGKAIVKSAPKILLNST